MSGPIVNLTFPAGHKIEKVGEWMALMTGFEREAQTLTSLLLAEFKGGLFINNEFVSGEDGKTIDVVNPSTGKVIGAVSEASAKDVDRAVSVNLPCSKKISEELPFSDPSSCTSREAAEKAFNTVWGEKVPGHARGKMLMDLANLFDEHADIIASIESIDNGKAFGFSRNFDVTEAAACLRYYAGWADKDHGKVIEVDDSKLAYTRHEPIGVVGQIIPWNFPILMFCWKLGPALATGNTIVIKVAESTPLSALYAAHLVAKVFPPGVVNVITGYGHITGAAISSHMKISKVAFTGSTAVGRTIMRSAASSNLKNVTLELGGKSPNIIFDDADLEQAAGWACFGLFFNHGQVCSAGSRVYVQEGIYDKFLALLTQKVHALKVGSPFADDTFQGPQTSELQHTRIMAHIQSGQDEGATLHTGGNRHGTEGFFIEPTIFTDVKPDMKIVREEIFGPVLVVSKFKDEDDTVFSRDISRAIGTAHKLHAGPGSGSLDLTNPVPPCFSELSGLIAITSSTPRFLSVRDNFRFPFGLHLISVSVSGGFKESGIGRELGEYALHNYTAVKAVHVNLHGKTPL
ncbi:hypothetical protein P7C70_g3931, partial [Phenoliferia sp. Uapishka_3]